MRESVCPLSCPEAWIRILVEKHQWRESGRQEAQDEHPKNAWKIQPEDIAEIVMTLLKMPRRTTISQIRGQAVTPGWKVAVKRTKKVWLSHLASRVLLTGCESGLDAKETVGEKEHGPVK